ncbi:unnamed protein product, partial [Closterium sp. Naga37s-1]
LARLVQHWKPEKPFRPWRETSDVCSLKGKHLRINCSADGDVVSLALSKLRIVGQLSEDIGNLTALTSLKLSTNRFRGPLPDSLSRLSKLESLRLERNRLSGSFPPGLSALTALTLLFANNNSFSGALPAFFGSMANLSELKLFGNPMGGSLPESFSQLKNLTHLHLADMGLSGPIPDSWGNMKSLQYFYALPFLLPLHPPIYLSPCLYPPAFPTSRFALPWLDLPTLFAFHAFPACLPACLPPPCSTPMQLGLSKSAAGGQAAALLSHHSVPRHSLCPGHQASLPRAPRRLLLPGIPSNRPALLLQHLQRILPRMQTTLAITSRHSRRGIGECGGAAAGAACSALSWERELQQGFRKYTWREVMEATNQLSPDNLLGKGGFGSVYLGVIGGSQQSGWSTGVWKRAEASWKAANSGMGAGDGKVGANSKSGESGKSGKSRESGPRGWSGTSGGVGTADARIGTSAESATCMGSAGIGSTASVAPLGDSAPGVGGGVHVAGGGVHVVGGMEVAIKRAAVVERSSNVATMFEEEVKAVSKLSHKNLVRLLGYCNENNEQVLVYEYVRNGDISDHLYARFCGHLLTFEERLDAALGLAEGLKYLHYHAEKPIVHRDIKPCNVLLTEDYQLQCAAAGDGVGPAGHSQLQCVAAGDGDGAASHGERPQRPDLPQAHHLLVPPALFLTRFTAFLISPHPSMSLPIPPRPSSFLLVRLPYVRQCHKSSAGRFESSNIFFPRPLFQPVSPPGGGVHRAWGDPHPRDPLTVLSSAASPYPPSTTPIPPSPTLPPCPPLSLPGGAGRHTLANISSSRLFINPAPPQAVPYIERGEIREIADARMASPLNLPFLLQMARTAALCVQLPSTRRPDMAEVARVMLDARRTFHAAAAAAAAGAAALAAAGGAAGALGGKGSPRGAEVGRSGLVGASGRALGSESMKRWVHYFGGGGGGRSRQESNRFEETVPKGTGPTEGGVESG